MVKSLFNCDNRTLRTIILILRGRLGSGEGMTTYFLGCLHGASKPFLELRCLHS